MPYLSLVVPVYNEEENLPLLFDAIHKVLDPAQYSLELILVDDGSRDNSLAVLTELQAKDPEHLRLVIFRRNFGQTAAIAAGTAIAAVAVGGHAKERPLGHGGQQIAAVDNHNRSLAVVGAGMDDAGHEATAGAALAGEHDAGW